MKYFAANTLRQHLTWSQPNFVRICSLLHLESESAQGKVRMLTERDAITLIAVDVLQTRGVLQAKSIRIGHVVFEYLPKLTDSMWLIAKPSPNSESDLVHITLDSEQVLAALQADPGILVVALHSLVRDARKLLETTGLNGGTE